MAVNGDTHAGAGSPTLQPHAPTSRVTAHPMATWNRNGPRRQPQALAAEDSHVPVTLSSVPEPTRSIRLHIERLVIDGPLLAGASPASLKAAVEAELVRQLGEAEFEPMLQDGYAMDAIAAPGIDLSQPRRGSPLGSEIGRAVAAAIASQKSH